MVLRADQILPSGSFGCAARQADGGGRRTRCRAQLDRRQCDRHGGGIAVDVDGAAQDRGLWLGCGRRQVIGQRCSVGERVRLAVAIGVDGLQRAALGVDQRVGDAVAIGVGPRDQVAVGIAELVGNAVAVRVGAGHRVAVGITECIGDAVAIGVDAHDHSAGVGAVVSIRQPECRATDGGEPQRDHGQPGEHHPEAVGEQRALDVRGGDRRARRPAPSRDQDVVLGPFPGPVARAPDIGLGDSALTGLQGHRRRAERHGHVGGFTAQCDVDRKRLVVGDVEVEPRLATGPDRGGLRYELDPCDGLDRDRERRERRPVTRPARCRLEGSGMLADAERAWHRHDDIRRRRGAGENRHSQRWRCGRLVQRIRGQSDDADGVDRVGRAVVEDLDPTDDGLTGRCPDRGRVGDEAEAHGRIAKSGTTMSTPGWVRTTSESSGSEASGLANTATT